MSWKEALVVMLFVGGFVGIIVYTAKSDNKRAEIVQECSVSCGVTKVTAYQRRMPLYDR